MVHRGRKGKIAIAQRPAGGEQHIAGAKIKPLGAHVLAGRNGCRNDDIGADALGALLDDDRVGAGWKHAAREDARGLAST